MNTNFQYIKKVAPLFTTLVFIAGIVSAYTYNSPSVGTSTNPYKLVDVGTDPNVKTGDISVNAFTAMQDANFNSSVRFFGPLHGAPNNLGGTNLRFGGYDEIRQKTRVVNISATGDVQASAGLFSQKTTTPSGTAPLCATSAGEVVLCSSTPIAPICGNGVLQSGEQCDDGNTTSGDGCSATCAIEPPPVVSDLCPDATNPNPRFAGVQNPLPSDVTLRNGLCKIKISADVIYQCINGSTKYTFSFDRPVPEDLNIYVAHTTSGDYNNCLGFPNSYCQHLADTSTYYGFQFLPLTKEHDIPGWFINLNKGMTSHVTPYPKLSNGTPEGSYQSSSPQEQCLDATNLSYVKTSAVYFKVGFSTPDYVTDFRLKNYTGPVSGFHYVNQ